MGLSDKTCGDACWRAREDVCRCACRGHNHGILRTADGAQPVRTRRIGGYVYELLAVEVPVPDTCRAATMRPLEDQGREVVRQWIAQGKWDRHDWPSTPGYPVLLRTAGESEVRRWPELVAWRSHRARPLVSWIRQDVA